jgi:hypothetical protein
MWKIIDGKLMQTTDDSRVKFRTNISKSTLESLDSLAKQNNTHVNYLIENGLINLIQKGTIDFNKDKRPYDRIQFKTSYDKGLLSELKVFAKKHKLFMNDVIEHSIGFIHISDVKRADYRYRIEKEK